MNTFALCGSAVVENDWMLQGCKRQPMFPWLRATENIRPVFSIPFCAGELVNMFNAAVVQPDRSDPPACDCSC